jgi:hypothetical protein
MAESGVIILLANATATPAQWTKLGMGGVYTLSADGVFGGATVGLQLKGPGAVVFNGPVETQFTNTGICTIDIGASQEVRMAVTGGTPSALNAVLRLVHR